jgi:pimeloyl-ACP methyl ester carboxylesterase
MPIRFTHFLGLHAALVLLFTTPGGAQTILPKPQVADELIKPVPQLTRDEYYEKLRDALRRNTPRIVFVPGVLGSKIDECRTDGSQCTTIWGTQGTLISLTGDGLSIKSDRMYRTDIVESVLFKNIYGDVLEHIRARAAELISDAREDPPLTVFHYDWRQSNWDNAVGLAKAICGVRAAAPDSPIIIIAHSMGGLMTKVWLKGHSDVACPNGTKPDVKRVVFVATPHLGSPKTIKAILQGYNYLFEETNVLSRPLGRFATNYLLNAFNQAGPSFPSIYELLPIRSSEYCTATKKSLASTAVPAASNDGKPINIFDPETWQKHDFLNRLGGSADSRNVYYAQRIAPLLKRSERLLCELADFDPSKATEVMYVVGREKGANTIGWTSLRLGAADIFEKSTNVEGDGTVPFYSAKNTLINSNSEPLVIDADHLRIISHLEVTRKIDGWYNEAEVSARRELASLGNAEFDTIMLAETAASGSLFPVSLNAREWPNPDNQFAIKINTRALDAMGYSSSDVADFAFWSDSLDRAHLYAISASTTNSPGDKAAWLTDVAKLAYIYSQYDVAIANSELVLGTKTDSQKAIPNFAELEKEATKLAGWSYLQRGDREKFNTVASEFTKKFSVEFSNPASTVDAFDDKRLVPLVKMGKGKFGFPMDYYLPNDHYLAERSPYSSNSGSIYRPN